MLAQLEQLCATMDALKSAVVEPNREAVETSGEGGVEPSEVEELNGDESGAAATDSPTSRRGVVFCQTWKASSAVATSAGAAVGSPPSSSPSKGLHDSAAILALVANVQYQIEGTKQIVNEQADEHADEQADGAFHVHMSSRTGSIDVRTGDEVVHLSRPSPSLGGGRGQHGASPSASPVRQGRGKGRVVINMEEESTFGRIPARSIGWGDVLQGGVGGTERLNTYIGTVEGRAGPTSPATFLFPSPVPQGQNNRINSYFRTQPLETDRVAGGGPPAGAIQVRDSVLPPQDVSCRVNQSVNISTRRSSSSARSVSGLSGKALCGYSSFSRSLDFGRGGVGGGTETRRRRKGGGVRGKKGKGCKGSTFGKASRDAGRSWIPASKRATGGRGGGGGNPGPPLSLRSAAARSANNVPPRSRNGECGGGFRRKRAEVGGASVQNSDPTANHSNLLHLDPQLHSAVEDAETWQASGSPRQAYNERNGLFDTAKLFEQVLKRMNE